MKSLSNFSLWIILATIAPGFVTIASVALMMYIIDPELLIAYSWVMAKLDYWLIFSIAVLIMILTQSIGIIQEAIFKKLKLYKVCSANFDFELYNVSLKLDKNLGNDNAFQRIASQFHLSNNILVSFGLAILAGVFVYFYQPFESLITYSSSRFMWGLIFFIFFYILILITARVRYNLLQRTIDYINKEYK